MDLSPDLIEPEQLLLDPNNYRFHDLPSYRPVPRRERYGDLAVQNRAKDLLQNTERFELQALKDSIVTNGYVALERIVVEEYDRDSSGKRYLVVEGNRRVAAVKLLIEELDFCSLTTEAPRDDSEASVSFVGPISGNAKPTSLERGQAR